MRVGGRVRYVIPPTSPDFAVTILSDQDRARTYLEILASCPQVGSLPLLRATLKGEASTFSRGKINLVRLARVARESHRG